MNIEGASTARAIYHLVRDRGLLKDEEGAQEAMAACLSAFSVISCRVFGIEVGTVMASETLRRGADYVTGNFSRTLLGEILRNEDEEMGSGVNGISL